MRDLEVGGLDIQVSKRNTKPLIGIVGGIASGKSSVAAEFAKLGCAVIDADAIVHRLLETDAVRDEIVAQFGPEVLDGTGRVNRRELGRIVFMDSRKVAALNAIIHPRVLEETEELLARYQRDSRAKAVVLDMPLLLEVGWAQRCDKVIFVDCANERRFERARRTRSLTEREVKKRENFQISLDTKKRRADNTIDNNSEFSTLVRQTNDIFSGIAKSS